MDLQKQLVNSNFSDLKIYLIYNEGDFSQDINEIKNESKIIIIDVFFQKINQIYYFIIVGSDFLFFISYSCLYLFQTFFTNNEDSTIYFLHKNEKQFRSEYFFKEQIKIDYKSPEEDENILLSETSSLMQYMNNHDKLWPVIYSFCIKNAYRKSKKKNKLDIYMTKMLNQEKASNQKKLTHQKITSNYKIFNESDFFQLRLIGTGYSSRVSLMYNIKKNKLFAFKTLKDLNEDSLNSQQREINNYLKICHPFIPKYYGLIENKTTNSKSIVLEFIIGKSLNDIHQLKLKEKEKIKIIFQMLIVIEYFHNNNFVYRDLKPSNIMINHDKTVVFIDFDRMVSLDDLKDDDNYTSDFSSDFVAKELNEGFISFKNDIYSIGLMIYYIIMETMAKFKNDKYQFDFPSNYSNLINICQRCTLDNPEERPCISELIDFFYINYFSKIQIKDLFNKEDEQSLIELSEINTIKTVKNIHDNSFVQYWAVLSEYNYPKSQYYFSQIYSQYREGNLLNKDDKKFINYLICASNNNVSESKFEIAFHYYYGVDVKQDIQKAIHLLNSLMDRNDFSYGQYFLGSIYYSGKYVPKDINKSIYLISKAANNNDSDALYFLGFHSLIGQIMRQDTDKAICCLTIAANNNHAPSQNVLGLIYSDNHYNKYDLKKSEYYFNLAIQQNNKDAEVNLANMYLMANRIDEAIRLYELAANQNVTIAIFNLSIIFLTYKNDINKFVYYLKRAADLNYPVANFILGCIYYEGSYVVRDVSKGIYYLELAVKQNEPMAFVNLGLIYYYGFYIEKNIDKAIHYFLIAAEHNIPMAQNMLGCIFLSIEYNRIDVDKGIYYLTLAANQKYNLGLYNLGCLFLNGKYIKKDINKAMYYLTMASNLNCKLAQKLLGDMYVFGIDIPRNIIKAIQYYSMAASSYDFDRYYSYDKENLVNFLTHEYNYYFLPNSKVFFSERTQLNENLDAILNLGFLYHEGKYVIQDIEKAIYYYKKVSSYNNQFAKNNLGVIYQSFDNENKNIALAIEYFNEAIHQKNDSVAKYNLSYIYLFELINDEYLNKSIKLLINSFNEDFDCSINLLCLALIMKYKILNIDIIDCELTNHKNTSKELKYKIFQIFQYFHLDEDQYFQKYSQILKSVLYIYTIEGIISSNQTNIKRSQDEIKKQMQSNINEKFYEGFGLDSLQIKK